MEHDHAVGVRHLVAQVCRPQHRNAALGAHPEQELEQVAAARRIEPDRRLVHQQHARIVHQGAHQLHAPPVAAAERRRLVAGAILERQPRKLVVDALLRRRARHAVQSGMEHQVGGDGELEIEGRLLEHDAELRQCRHRIA